eukprot:TRINITY_DN5705_c0_g1_i1.p1 TRINITY_DN5705_c0_g1~~TRINITY_DN5705_c0_g1_i1.p1  ORF type:complete len:218 (+),score=-16.61 TRINITY_DN5705_c0_g1_i1:34-654(+)
MEKMALDKSVLSLHDIGSGSLFVDGRFLFPLQRKTRGLNTLCPWHLKMSMGFECDKEEVCAFLTKKYSLHPHMNKRILSSLNNICDGRKFTAQFQISAGLIKFYRPCKDCGMLYNHASHTFVDCPAIVHLKRFCFLNVGGLDDRSSSSLRTIILFGLSSRGRKTSDKTKALDFALLNAKALIAKKTFKIRTNKTGRDQRDPAWSCR